MYNIYILVYFYDILKKKEGIMMNENDLRVIKTKNALYTALQDLMKEKTFEEIKVADICAKALINRSTFYAHFQDKYELLASSINDLKTSLTNELNKNQNFNSTKEYYIEMIKLFLNHIEEKKDTYLAIAINNRNSILTDIIYDVMDNDIIAKLKEEKEEITKVPKHIIAKFYLGAVANVGIYWIYNLNKYSKEEMINYLTILIPNEIL